ncbi:muscarinic acetylcholine receptor M2-like [Asterias amurensis]|uniref:muscarinic acetylcholine receptor M2-like n=1 Tax=Asterias amurensis TaxID=7602 RepID=UPI003AB45365
MELNSTMQQTTQMWTNDSGLLPSSNDTYYIYENELELNDSYWANISSSDEPENVPGFSYPKLPHLTLKVILCTTVLVLTLLGNVLVIWAYATTKKLRTYSNHLIIGLAVADLVSGGITPGAINMTWYFGYWPYGEYFCLVFVYTNHIFIHATFLMTMIICFDRFWALNMPLHHLKGKSTRRAYSMIAVAYIVPVLIWTPLVIIFPYTGVTIKIEPPACFPSYGLHPYLLLFAVLALSWIPMIATIILYAFVYSAVIRKGQGNKRSTGERISSDFTDKKLSRKVQSKRSVKDIHIKRYSTNAAHINGTQKKANSQSCEPPERDIHSMTHKRGTEPPTTNTNTLSNDQPIMHIQDSIQVLSNGHTESIENTHETNCDSSARTAQDTLSKAPMAKDGPDTMYTNRVFSVSRDLGFTNQGFEDTEDCNNHITHSLKVPQAVSRPGKPIIKQSSSRRSKLESRLASIRATRTLTWILIMMLISGLPWSVTPILLYTIPTLKVSPYTSMFLGWMAHLSSLVNPFCYAISNPLFKAAFLRILRCRKPDRRSNSSAERSRQRNSQASQNRK